MAFWTKSRPPYCHFSEFATSQCMLGMTRPWRMVSRSSDIAMVESIMCITKAKSAS